MILFNYNFIHKYNSTDLKFDETLCTFIFNQNFSKFTFQLQCNCKNTSLFSSIFSNLYQYLEAVLQSKDRKTLNSGQIPRDLSSNQKRPLLCQITTLQILHTSNKYLRIHQQLFQKQIVYSTVSMTQLPSNLSQKSQHNKSVFVCDCRSSH